MWTVEMYVCMKMQARQEKEGEQNPEEEKHKKNTCEIIIHITRFAYKISII